MDGDFVKLKNHKTIIIGAGPVGALAAIYAAQRGHNVAVYELRADLRKTSTRPSNVTRSINLALSERGINALKHSQRPDLTASILKKTITMKGRMIHGRDKSGRIWEESQDYDVNGRGIHAANRSVLNSQLLDELACFPNVKLFFNHKLVGVDLKSRKVKLEIVDSELIYPSEDLRHQGRIEDDFDLLIGSDGAHSATRLYMMKQMCMDFAQSYIDTLWCQFTIKSISSFDSNKPSKTEFRISSEHLHIWPGKEYMFIAIPSAGGDFICTLFAPAAIYKKLSESPDVLLEFFNQNFPGITPELIPHASLIQSFQENPHLPLISIKCSPHHFQDCAVLIGDATHAMVPFYGQGMNAGFEDVRVLFETLDKYMYSSKSLSDLHRLALEEYSALRIVDSQAISQLALDNYLEMRSSVKSRAYKSRKWLEEKLSLWFPSLGWATKYSRVSFGNERYSEVIKKSERQGILIVRVIGAIGIICTSGFFWGIWRLRRLLDLSS